MWTRIKEELTGIFVFIGVIWLVFLISFAPGLSLSSFGVVPRTMVGLIGIVTMPFLHGGWGHLISNTLPLLILLCLLAGSRARTWPVVAAVSVGSAGLLWAFGRGSNHIGASTLIYGLAAFLVVAGFRERRFVSIAAALITGFSFGGSMLLGILPTAGQQVSWDGHLAGAVGGIAAGVLLVPAKKSPRS